MGAFSHVDFSLHSTSILLRAFELLTLRGVSFHWRDKEMGEDRKIGVIAQEVEKVFPELVNTPKGGSKLVQYENFVPVLIEAFKEQQKTISQLQEEIETIKAQR